MKKQFIIAAAMLGAGMATQAAEVIVTNDIVTSTTWTSDNVYNMQEQIYVRPGATLSIEAGTLIQSDAGVGGSLAVSRGGKIFVNGTADKPVVMTSSNDDFTNLRVACNEWGNLTLMGRGLIGASSDAQRDRGDNTKYPTGLNVVQMEGLTDDGVNDVFYGGNDDNDDSGSISYLSLRYGGKVIGLANELNGLSLGAIGRETDIHHVEIMNNVDDGIEIWGGTVNLKYLNIWNIGDDSLDVDQGWRGKAQFGLIVQGYSAEAKQGSGFGDNCIEIDGAEDSDAQPATSTRIANFTVVGQPVKGDGATVWRDNARVQYHNCIFMDIGEEIVRFDNKDGDGGQGYGFAVSPTYTNDTDHVNAFLDIWSSSFDTYPVQNWSNAVYATQAEMYPVQTAGNLAEIRNSVMFRNATDEDDYATAVGVYEASMGNIVSAYDVSTPDVNMPIGSLTRGAPYTFTASGKTYTVVPVEHINPVAANDALVSAEVAGDEFYTPVAFRGGFSANNNWLAGWTAVDQYGMTDTSMNIANPSVTIEMVGTVISFVATQGVVYNVSSSADMMTWTPELTLVGTGATEVVADIVDEFDDAKFYRVTVQ